MKKSKKVAAFLMALAVTSMNVPMTISKGNSMMVYAAESSQTGIIIVKQPNNAVGAIGDTIAFTVEATGVSAYQWQYNAGNGWANWSKATSKTLEVEITSQKRKDYVFRCFLKGSDGTTKYTDEVCIEDKEIPASISISSQPKNAQGDIGDTVAFTVEATGVSAYQWQYNAGSGWANWSKATSKTLEVEITSQKRKDYIFRCFLKGTDGSTKYTDEVCIEDKEIPAGISISSQPKNAQGDIGDTVAFTVEATGVSAYQWQYNAGSGWANWSKATSKTLEVEITSQKRKDYIFRCFLKGTDGSTKYTDEVRIVNKLSLTHPESLTIIPTSSATFNIQATGTGDLTYSWESSVDNGTTWSVINGANGASLTVDGATAVSGTQYRCTVSDAYGQSKTSEPATLTIESASKPCGDNLTYTYKNGTLTISGTGEMWSYTDAESSPFNELDIDTLVIEDGVTVIGTHAFEGNSIQSVILPDSVFSVRYKSFYDNPGIDITIENIGCAIYKDAINGDATIQGYANSSAYDYAQANGQAFVSLNDDSYNGTSNKLVLTKGESATINVSGNGIKYRSFNNDIVTVSSDGTVTAVGDGEARVIAYDKQGNTTVFYYTVVEERNHPDPTRRYQIVSPASSEQSVTLFGDESISLNEDVAIAEGNYAYPAGSFGTAPILSVDNIGNSDIFYYTFDADIRPVNADVTYTEDVYALNNDWDYTYLNPYYSFTAEEDTRVYFKAYGEYDLNVSVYALPGIDPIAEDYNGGRAEVSFDVNAGETVYIQVSDSQNKSFPYTMSLSTTGIEVVEMSENEIYTITPDISGDLTTLSFTATEAGSYMIEGIGTTDFHYDFSDNSSFDNSNSIWPVIYDDEVLSYYYPNIEAGETVYIRGYFDNETTSDDLISFRVNAVTPVDTALTLNDMDNPNVLSFNPDDFDRRTIEGKAGAQYIISTDSRDTDVIVWDQNGNVVGLDHESNETGYTYFFNCDEDQIYYVLAIPTHTSENYGSVNVWVWENTDQAININLWDTYSFYNSRRAPVDYTFTAPMTGYYYLTSEYTGVTSYEYTDENGLVHEEGFDPAFDMYIYDNNYNTLHNFHLNPGMSEKDCAFYLEEGQEVKINFYQYELRGSDHIDFSLNWAKPGVIEVDRVLDNSIAPGNYAWYEFTAPADGTYCFSAASEECPIYFMVAKTSGIDWMNYDSNIEYTTELSEGETVWIRMYSDSDAPSTTVSFKVERNLINLINDRSAWRYEGNSYAQYSCGENGFEIGNEYGTDKLNGEYRMSYYFDVEPFSDYTLSFDYINTGNTTLKIELPSSMYIIPFELEESGSRTFIYPQTGIPENERKKITFVFTTEDAQYIILDNISLTSTSCILDSIEAKADTSTEKAHTFNLEGRTWVSGVKLNGAEINEQVPMTVQLTAENATRINHAYLIKDLSSNVYSSGIQLDTNNRYTFEPGTFTDGTWYLIVECIPVENMNMCGYTVTYSYALPEEEEIIPDDVIEEVICDECGGVKPDHEDWCSHYGEDDEEESYDD